MPQILFRYNTYISCIQKFHSAPRARSDRRPPHITSVHVKLKFLLEFLRRHHGDDDGIEGGKAISHIIRELFCYGIINSSCEIFIHILLHIYMGFELKSR